MTRHFNPACLPAFLLATCLTAPLAQAQTADHGVYAKVGFLGAGLGYAYSVSEQFSVRTDFTTVGTISRNRTEGRLDYKASLKADQLGVYGDWFPFNNGFRLSVGLHARKLEVKAKARPNASGSVTINNTEVAYGSGDEASGRVKFPTVAPYLGIGWGHHSGAKGGLDFAFDLGVSYGKPKTRLNTNASLTAKLEAAAAANGTTASAELETQRRKLADTADKLKFFPQIYVGLAYRF